MISSVRQYDSGTYTCRGYRGRDSQSSEISNAVTLTVSERAQAVLNVSPQSWLTEGDSVSLSCEVRDSSTGWTFSWYRSVPYRECLTPVTYNHSYVRYCVELLSDSIRGSGGSYTLSPAAQHHTGVYVCRAERGEPAYQTQYSNTQPLWITGLSPPVSLIISPSRTQHFSGDSLSLSCEGQSDSTGWRVRRYTHSGNVSDCSSFRGSVTGSRRTIRYLYTSHTGVYWCQSESGGSSNPVNITVHNLPTTKLTVEPQNPVFTGESVTLKCEVQGYDGWTYQWRYKKKAQSQWTTVSQSVFYTVNRDTLTISGDAVVNGDQYQCRGERHDRPTTSKSSNIVTITVHGKITAT
uniref:Ig-like domain-containing protein n=2 Tax=Electrophorus electricus TaxID=8005 RepID=A0AAY5F0C1_ELEEL